MINKLDKTVIIDQLNRILEFELAGVVRYTHYSFMIFGYNRIPIIEWMEEQATESLAHAKEAGELITHFGGHPSLAIGSLLETHKHDIADILRESLVHEREAFIAYQQLLELVKDKSVLLEEYARRLIAEEEMHQGEVDKMLRNPGDIESVSAS